VCQSRVRGRACGHGDQRLRRARGRRPKPAGRHVRGGQGRGGRPRQSVLCHRHGTGARGGRTGRRGRGAPVHVGAEQHRRFRAVGIPERGQEHAAPGHHTGPAQGGPVPVHHAPAARGRGPVRRPGVGGRGRPPGAHRGLAPGPRPGHIVPASRAAVHRAAAGRRPVRARAVDVRGRAPARGPVLLGPGARPAAADRRQQGGRGRGPRQPGRAQAPFARRRDRRHIRQARCQLGAPAEAHEASVRPTA